MDKNVKKRWVKALRSGDYTQGKGKLRSSEGKFCCLGVLCDTMKVFPGSWGQAFTPRKLSRSIGLSKKQEEKLIGMNDGHTWNGIPESSFQEIANYIEKEL